MAAMEKRPASDVNRSDGDDVEHRKLAEFSSHEDINLPTTPFVVLFALFISLGGLLLNFDLTYAGTVLQMNAFKSSFGTCHQDSASHTTVCTLSALRQSLQNISSLFIGLGALLSGLAGPYLGRRAFIQVGCAIQAIGAASLMGTAGNYAAYVACKCIVGFGLGLLYTSTIPYGVEFLPPQRRGAMMALFGVGLSLGQISVSIVCYGSSFLRNNWAWKTPIICEIPLALFYGTVITLFPESPRWLVLRDRDQHAVEAFLRMYKGYLTGHAAEALVLSVRRNIESDNNLAKDTKMTDIFKRNYIGRLWTACLVVISNVLCGTFFVNMYAALFFGQLNVQQNPFALTCIIGACTFPGALVGPYFAETLGRRRAQLTGYTILGILMLIIGVFNSALGTADQETVVVVVVLFCLWQVVLGALLTSTVWLLAGEVHSVRLRTAGQAFVMGVCFVFQFANNFWTPYMLNPDYGNMGVNITYYFFGLSAVFVVLIYIFVPETGQLSLEQIDELIASCVRPWSTSLKKNRALARGQESSYPGLKE